MNHLPDESQRAEEYPQPGLARTPDELAKRLGTWIGFGLLVWGVLLGVVVVTVKVIQSLI